MGGQAIPQQRGLLATQEPPQLTKTWIRLSVL
jgi:hypothetical protein